MTMRRDERRPIRPPWRGLQSPLQIYGSDLVLWFASDRGVTLIENKASSLADQSSYARTATQATAANRPSYTTADATLNNKPALIFNASQWMTVEHFADGEVSSAGLAAYLIGSFPASAADKQLFGKWTSWGVNQSTAAAGDAPSSLAYDGSTVYAHSNSSPIDDGAVHLIRFVAADATHVGIDVDGAATVTATHNGYLASTNPLYLGTLGVPTITGAVVNLGEVVVVKINPSPQQDLQTRLWLNSRYG